MNRDEQSVWQSRDFWNDVLANLVAFGIGIALIVIIEKAKGKRVEALH